MRNVSLAVPSTIADRELPGCDNNLTFTMSIRHGDIVVSPLLRNVSLAVPSHIADRELPGCDNNLTFTMSIRHGDIVVFTSLEECKFSSTI